MRVDIMTLFPDSMRAVLGESIIGRAAKKGILEINCVQIRDYTDNKQRQVDDYPYGGGWGCVMMAQPLKACLDDIMSTAAGRCSRVIYMSPQGKPFTQADAVRLRDDYDHLVLVCGHYEGVDERFIELCADEEISIGDFVLTGGEIPAMALADAVCRLVPGVLSDEECFTGESHWSGLLEYPQYTRPEVWEGLSVPPELLTGDHAAVEKWRRRKSLERTADKRPDMLAGFEPESGAEKRYLSELFEARGLRPLVYGFDQRRAVTGDLPGIMAIIADAQKYLAELGVTQWQCGYPSAEDFAADIEAGSCWLFLYRGECAGVMTVSPGPDREYKNLLCGSWFCEGDDYFVIHRCAVRSDMRGTPLAGEMADFAEALCAGSGKASLRADTHYENRAMTNLLVKRGFKRCGLIKITKNGGEDPYRVAYEKVL